MTGCEPIWPGISKTIPPMIGASSQENFLFTVTVTAELLGGTRNLVCDGKDPIWSMACANIA